MARWGARLSPGLGASLRISHARYDDLERPCPFAAHSTSVTSSLGTVTEKLLVVRMGAPSIARATLFWLCEEASSAQSRDCQHSRSCGKTCIAPRPPWEWRKEKRATHQSLLGQSVRASRLTSCSIFQGFVPITTLQRLRACSTTSLARLTLEDIFS